ncbi:MAG: gamma-glutamylcyclotransferase [Rickettsiales bacterium]|nr:gamma-glutamylcyclotransferase [Rickettsiales bacterium]|tara:strand:- start:1321 stop:1893 length:573 start_codon:yes stop_codon:yes gene_type:complete
MELSSFLRKYKLDITDKIWIFGYGSVLWKQGFDFIDSKHAFLPGYHRRFCIFSHHHRGTEDNPGLVLGLDRGGGCHGMVFQLNGEGQMRSSLENLWDREVREFYVPHYLDLWVEGEKEKALVFMLDRDHPNFFDDIDKNEAARVILSAEGASGTNLEYFLQTKAWLDEYGIVDEQIRNLGFKIAEHQTKY